MRNSAETNPRRMSRRAFFGLAGGTAAAAVLTIAGIGCGDGGADTPSSPAGTERPTDSPPFTGSPTPSPDNPTATPTETPSKVGYQELDKGLIYTTEKGEILNVPQIQ